MYVIVELTRTRAIKIDYTPTEAPFVVAAKLYYGSVNEDVADFWKTTFGVSEPVTSKTRILGVIYNYSINYNTKTSLNDCLNEIGSYFWDNDNQILYIHYNLLQKISVQLLNFSYGLGIGITNDKMRYFESRPYYPFLLDYPQVEISVDKINYDKLSTIVSSLSFDNKTRFFNQFKETPIYGNKVIVKTGHEGDTYDDLIERAVYYVENYTFSSNKFEVDIQDLRKTLTAQIPNKVLNTTDYPYLGDTTKGELIRLGYGKLRDVKGYCVNEGNLALADPIFIFLEVLTGSVVTDITIYVKNSDDVWIQDTGITVDWTTGLVTVPSAKTGTSPDFNVLDVKADCEGIPNTYASDIIKDLNERYLYINYDDSNYATTQWEAEETYLSAIGLYMNETKDIYEWIKDIQSLSSVGFRYMNNYKDKRTIKVDNPNRNISLAVRKEFIKDIPDIVAESDRDDVYNKIYIGYNQSLLNKTAERVENDDYYDESFAEYEITRVYNKITGLLVEADAINRAAIQAEDYAWIHKVFEVTIIGEDYLNIELYDVITCEISLEKLVITMNDCYIDTIDADLSIQEELIAENIKTVVLSNLSTTYIGDEYFGIVRGQVISVKPDYVLKTNTIKLRQRDYSSVWEGIYG